MIDLTFGRLDACDALMDTPPEPAFDRITRLAASILGVPITMVSVLDSRRNFFKSAVGLPDAVREAREIPLSYSYCRHVVASGEMLAVPDTLEHPLVSTNPTNLEYGVRAYLGFPVRNPAGEIVCSLCALDMVPRDWSASERADMEVLADILGSELALREELRVRRAAEEHVALLFREMEHRVKNSLAKVQAIVSLSLRGRSEFDDVRRTVTQRIAALARTQSLLLRSDWRGALLSEVLRGELDHYGGADLFEMTGPDLQLGSEDAAIIGLVAHELATNAAKYGAIAAGGRIVVAWSEESRDDGRRLSFRWNEEGVALTPSLPSTDGFGSTLMEALVVRQRNGRILRDWRPTGLAIAIDIDLDAAV